MRQARTEQADRETKPSADMSEEDKRSVNELSSGSAKVVHEVVRLQGDEELSRPVQSLLFSGFAAGVAISSSVLAEAFLHMRLPSAAWSELVVALGYTVGFVIVILGAVSLWAGFNIFSLIRYLKEELFLVLGTSSSESALPALMDKMERAGCARPVVGLTR